MAGYADDFSKSNNAIIAENAGLFPASKIAKKLGNGCTAKGVKETLTPAEWHHTSSFYNTTDYFDLEEATERIDEIKAASTIEKKSVTLTGAIVTWLEWGGSRNHPTASEQTAENCTVEYKGGAFCTVTLPSGKVMKKKLDTNGFRINGTYPDFVLN
jgi:hypothetical protein